MQRASFYITLETSLNEEGYYPEQEEILRKIISERKRFDESFDTSANGKVNLCLFLDNSQVLDQTNDITVKMVVYSIGSNFDQVGFDDKIYQKALAELNEIADYINQHRIPVGEEWLRIDKSDLDYSYLDWSLSEITSLNSLE